MQPLTPGKRFFAVGDLYGDEETTWNTNFGDRIVTDTGLAGETRVFVPPAGRTAIEVVYIQFDQPDGTNIPDRHTSRWVPRGALCTSRFGHVHKDPGKPCVFCGYEPLDQAVAEAASGPCAAHDGR